MRSRGYTLIELLVVISIIALMAVLSFISYGSFAKDKAAEKALGEVQTVLRLAQSNATSSTLCNGQAAANWKVLVPVGGSSLQLHCDPENYLQRTYTLGGANMDTITPDGCSPLSFPVTLLYSAGVGDLTITPSSPCSQNASKFVFTVKDLTGTSTRTFNLSKGGAIDVQ